MTNLLFRTIPNTVHIKEVRGLHTKLTHRYPGKFNGSSILTNPSCIVNMSVCAKPEKCHILGLIFNICKNTWRYSILCVLVNRVCATDLLWSSEVFWRHFLTRASYLYKQSNLTNKSLQSQISNLV